MSISRGVNKKYGSSKFRVDSDLPFEHVGRSVYSTIR